MDPYRESWLIALIPLLPLIGCVLLALFGRRLPERWIAGLALAGPAAAFAVALGLFRGLGAAPATHQVYQWFAAGGLVVPVAFTWDGLSATMALVVSGVGGLIHVYSAGYMAGDKGYARYFCYLNLFTGMMLVLVLAENLPLMFVGWEGVGLCSYLLIGFWFEDREKAAAGMKAFLVNRIGDACFLIGMFLAFGVFGSLSFAALGGSAPGLSAGMATAITLLLFAGAVGKSAQIPLYVWLPDAMAGPTPVSALIHAATMVTAGVYMIARLGGLFLAAPATCAAVALVGAGTAFYAATIALTQNDIKKVLAYSTISQLGYMFVAMGLGAFAAGMFHLVTHAFFKALLFLGAGAVIHACGGEQDMRRMGGLSRSQPLVFLCFLVGALALAGVPPLAGFWSKDLILEGALGEALAGHQLPGGVAWLVYYLCAGGACLTAFYTFRMVALVFLGEPAASHAHGHDPSPGMAGVLLALAALSITGGLVDLPAAAGPWGKLLSGVLEPVIGRSPPHHGNEALINLAVSLPLVAAGALAGLLAYTRWREAWAALWSKGLLALLAGGSAAAWHVDRLASAASRRLSLAAARVLLLVDQLGIDAAFDSLPRGAYAMGQELRRGQAGRLQGYLLLFGLGVAAVFAYLFGVTELLPWIERR